MKKNLLFYVLCLFLGFGCVVAESEKEEECLDEDWWATYELISNSGCTDAQINNTRTRFFLRRPFSTMFPTSGVSVQDVAQSVSVPGCQFDLDYAGKPMTYKLDKSTGNIMTIQDGCTSEYKRID